VESSINDNDKVDGGLLLHSGLFPDSALNSWDILSQVLTPNIYSIVDFNY
jgi:hypothetical protein